MDADDRLGHGCNRSTADEDNNSISSSNGNKKDKKIKAKMMKDGRFFKQNQYEIT
ncbi:hypothetical protein Gohar_015911, partial [Gossypium harknessii]|nr:hypothetical protein [Gossypium harknessii]